MSWVYRNGKLIDMDHVVAVTRDTVVTKQKKYHGLNFHLVNGASSTLKYPDENSRNTGFDDLCNDLEATAL